MIQAMEMYNVLLFLIALCHSNAEVSEIELMQCQMDNLEKSNEALERTCDKTFNMLEKSYDLLWKSYNRLEKSYDNLEKSYAAVQEEIKGLKKGVQKTELKLDSLKTGPTNLTRIVREVSTLSMYCKYLPVDICGKCTCLDDYDLEKRFYCDCQHFPVARDCLEHLRAGYQTSGVYRVNAGGLKDIQVYCDQDTDKGGWTVFQRRINGETHFYRNWQLYKQGFGFVRREFWLGNDNLHILSLKAAYPKGSELRVEMMDWDGNSYYAKYTSFSVDSENTKYKLLVEGYQGNCGDSLGYHNKGLFSTYDSDNDGYSGDCSENYLGGWWYKGCYHSNLNGEYKLKHEGLATSQGLSWYRLKNKHISMKRVEMKLRRKL